MPTAAAAANAPSASKPGNKAGAMVLRVIAEILGHSDIRVTSAVYAHVSEQLQRDAAERMATALDW